MLKRVAGLTYQASLTLRSYPLVCRLQKTFAEKEEVLKRFYSEGSFHAKELHFSSVTSIFVKDFLIVLSLLCLSLYLLYSYWAARAYFLMGVSYYFVRSVL